MRLNSGTTALHEAGHAVVGHDVGLTVVLVEVLSTPTVEFGQPRGRVVTEELERYRHTTPAAAWKVDAKYREFVNRDLIQRMAGVPAACLGTDVAPVPTDLEAFRSHDGSGGDFWAAWRVANDVAQMELGPEASTGQCHAMATCRLEEALRAAAGILRLRWHDVVAVAGELERRNRLERHDFLSLLGNPPE